MADEKPLFIPLRRQWFEAFQAGLKVEEFRPAGGRWNARTCRIGRPVTLSLGYGKHHRLAGVITGFREDPAITQTEVWRSIYGDRYASAVAIRIALTPPGSTVSSSSGAVGASPRPPQGASAATGRCCPAGLPIVALQATTLRAAPGAVGDPPPAAQPLADASPFLTTGQSSTHPVRRKGSFEMTRQSEENAVFVVGYVISDAAGHYSRTQTYQTYAKAAARWNSEAGEAVGAVLSDGSVTFEI